MSEDTIDLGDISAHASIDDTLEFLESAALKGRKVKLRHNGNRCPYLRIGLVINCTPCAPEDALGFFYRAMESAHQSWKSDPAVQDMYPHAAEGLDLINKSSAFYNIH